VILKKQFVFQVDRSKSPPSKAAFHPRFVNPETGKMEVAPVLLDFRFDPLRSANEILRHADRKLKMLVPSPNAQNSQTLGERLAEARKSSGHTQEELADILGKKIDHKYISEWERGRRYPKKHLSTVLAYVEQAAKKAPLKKTPKKTTQK
jgi:DNA-binding transcriptional regulator YiaG